MAELNPRCVEALQSELLPGESLYWTGQPNPSIIFHKEDAMMIPFSLLWGGFAIFWEFGAAGFFGSTKPAGASTNWFFLLWGIPFIVIGQYLIWGRFVVAAWKKKRTYYGVTNRRVLVVQDAWSRKMVSAYIENLLSISKDMSRSGIGTLRFGPQNASYSNNRSGFSAWDGMNVSDTPVFADIDNVDGVYRQLNELKEKTGDSPRRFAP